MIESPTIEKIERQNTAVIRQAITRSQIKDVMGPGVKELMMTLKGQGVKPAGPWFARYLKMDGANLDFEIGVPVNTEVKPEGRVQLSEIPAATVARTIFQGPYENLYSAWTEFSKWIAEQKRQPKPALWETYLTNPTKNPDPSTWRTEMNQPLAD